MMAYSNQLRQKLLQAADRQEFSQARLAEIFGVSLSWVRGSSHIQPVFR